MTTPPERLGDYRIVRERGRGGMGVVYEAIDEKLNRAVTVKVLYPERAGTSLARTRFEREARAVAAITHDNVVPIYHVGEHDGAPFLVMPLLHGESLDARRNRDGPVPVAEVVGVGRQVALGLAAAHAAGLIHRDIKPANVWLESPGGRVKLLDFGLARAADGADRMTLPDSSPGTPAFMSPEQVEGTPLDHRSDLFSLGATLYLCLTGKPAFDGPTLGAVWSAVLKHTPPPPRELNTSVPGPLSDLVMRLLAKDPAGRPPTAGAVADELDRLDGHGTPPPATAPRRRWLGWAGLIAAALVVAAVGGWLLTRDRGRGATPDPTADPGTVPAAPVTYRGKIDILVPRQEAGRRTELRLNSFGVLPLRRNDQFKVLVEVEPAAFVYVFWVEPDGTVVPVYPWDPEQEAWTRPPRESPVSRLPLPSADQDFTVDNDRGGVTTLIMLARPTPLDVPDEAVKAWFAGLPQLPLPDGEEGAAVGFDNYSRVAGDPLRSGVLKRVESGDVFQRWQSALQKRIGPAASFQTAVSFARAGRK